MTDTATSKTTGLLRRTYCRQLGVVSVRGETLKRAGKRLYILGASVSRLVPRERQTHRRLSRAWLGGRQGSNRPSSLRAVLT